jgi:hypothetical protein
MLCLTGQLQVKGENDKVNVKRLPKKPAPPRFGRKLTARQQELATHICVGKGRNRVPGNPECLTYEGLMACHDLCAVLMCVSHVTQQAVQALKWPLVLQPRTHNNICLAARLPTVTAALDLFKCVCKVTAILRSSSGHANLCSAACLPVFLQTAGGSTARPLPLRIPLTTTAAHSAMHPSAASWDTMQRLAR